MWKVHMITNFYYQVIYDYLYHPDLGWYHSYGIQVVVDNSKNQTSIHTIHDVSVCKSHAEFIARILNEENVDPVHFSDVVENHLEGI